MDSLSILPPPDIIPCFLLNTQTHTPQLRYLYSHSELLLTQPGVCVCRLDAGTFGTMGVGLGFAIAAATVQRNQNTSQRVVCVEGDSAFGFSGMEVETMCRLVQSRSLSHSKTWL